MTGKGTTFRLRHLQGKKLTPQQAILAKCSDCMADYCDGRVDCNVPECPLYPWMPYSSAPREKKHRGIVTERSEDGRLKKRSTSGLEGEWDG